MRLRVATNFDALMLVLLSIGVGFYFAIVNGTADFTALSVVSTLVLAFLAIFVVVILSIVLRLLRHFFWRISVLEDAGVGESLRRGFDRSCSRTGRALA